MGLFPQDLFLIPSSKQHQSTGISIIMEYVCKWKPIEGRSGCFLPNTWYLIKSKLCLSKFWTNIMLPITEKTSPICYWYYKLKMECLIWSQTFIFFWKLHIFLIWWWCFPNFDVFVSARHNIGTVCHTFFFYFFSCVPWLVLFLKCNSYLCGPSSYCTLPYAEVCCISLCIF